MTRSEARASTPQASQRHIASHVTCDAGPLRASHVTPPYRGDGVTRGDRSRIPLAVDFRMRGKSFRTPPDIPARNPAVRPTRRLGFGPALFMED